MNTHPILRTAAAAACLLALPLAQAQSPTVGKADYNAIKTRIGTDAAADKALCSSHVGNVRDVCMVEAKGREQVARADLEYSYTGKESDRSNALTVKADTAFAVAKERCDDKAGNAKDVCVEEAKAVKAKALADARMGQEIGAARSDAAAAKRDADFNVAVEKCDAMAGDAKDNCIAAAKAMFKKS